MNSLLNGSHPIAREMKKYIATPWCQCSLTKEWKDCSKCKPPMNAAKVVQAHGGDLFQHSQWSALYVTLWYQQANLYPKLHQLLTQVVNSKLFNTIISDDREEKIEFLQLCGFFHDIGKGGECTTARCVTYDMYHAKKYEGRGDQVHPEYSKNYILKPGKTYNQLLAPLLEELFARYKNPIQARLIVALCAAVHWDFGKLNIPSGVPGHLKPNQYIKGIRSNLREIINYINYGKAFSSNDFLTVIKLCMAVSCADVASAYNTELMQNSVNKQSINKESINKQTINKQSINKESINKQTINNRIGNITIAKATHLSNGGVWTEKQFTKTHPKYIRQVLSLLNKKTKKL